MSWCFLYWAVMTSWSSPNTLRGLGVFGGCLFWSISVLVCLWANVTLPYNVFVHLPHVYHAINVSSTWPCKFQEQFVWFHNLTNWDSDWYLYTDYVPRNFAKFFWWSSELFWFCALLCIFLIIISSVKILSFLFIICTLHLSFYWLILSGKMQWEE